MALTFTKKHVQRMAEVLDQDYETVEEAAKAALDAAYEIVVERAKFTVVGQIRRTENEEIHPSDERATKYALGWYATEKQALSDALKAALSTQTHEESRAWVLPIHNVTPSAFYQERHKKRKAEAIEDASYREAELARRERWVEENPGKPLPLDWTVEIACEAQTKLCKACDGLGRIPNDDLFTRADLPKTYY